MFIVAYTFNFRTALLTEQIELLCPSVRVLGLYMEGVRKLAFESGNSSNTMLLAECQQPCASKYTIISVFS